MSSIESVVTPSIESNSLATIFSFVLGDKKRAHAFFYTLSKHWTYGRIGSKSLALVLALNKALWSLRQRIFPYMFMCTSSTALYFKHRKYEDFTPYNLHIFCSSQENLAERLAILGSIPELTITKYGSKKVVVDLSTIQRIVGVKLTLTRLTVRGSASRPDGNDLKIVCNECHISPKANLGRGNVRVSMNQERQFRWEPLRYATKIKIVATSKNEGEDDFSPNERFLPAVFPKRMRVRELWIGGQYLYIPRIRGYYIPYASVPHLRKLTFPNRVDEYLLIEECKRLREVVLSSGTFMVTKEQASEVLLVHRGHLNRRLFPVGK